MPAGRAWLDPPPVSVPDALRIAAGGHPLVAETLARRGFGDPTTALAFLDPSRYNPAPATGLPGIGRAVTRLGRAIRGRERICVWGDFDVDGQTAAALLFACLADLGADVTYHVPVRETEGHGIRLPVLEQVIDAGAQLILTCDTGITANDAVAYAASRGVEIIITDHHDLPPALPEALAVVSTKLLGTEHPLYDLPGVGIAYKLSEALYEWARRPAEAERNLDLAALGIVADLALLRGDTRYLLQRGLACLRRTNRLGLQVLMEAAELDSSHLSEEHVGYVLAPRLNAAGRLADANPCVELLTLGVRGLGRPASAEQVRQDLTRARIIAADLTTLNARRKLECDNVERAAEAQISRDPALLDAPALVLDSPLWPAGIIGIVASRLVEEYGKPAILISTAGGSSGRASARSVEGLHVTEAIARHAELLAGFGGHPMAAGFTIDPDRIPEFRRAFNRTVSEILPGPRASGTLPLDGTLPLAQLSLDLADDLARLAPFGPGNPPLTLLAERLRARSSRQVGRNDEHRILLVADEAGNEREVIWWNGGDEATPEGLFDIAYVLRGSTYRGQRDVQVELIATRPSAGTEVVVTAAPAYEVIDHRGTDSPRTVLDALIADGDVAVWREGEAGRDVAGQGRHELPHAASLVVWTTPPGPAELRAALAGVGPQRVYILGIDPESGLPDAFLRRLAGLVNHVVSARAGRASIAALAAATAQRESTVRLGLALLAALGRVRVADQTGDEVMLAAGASEPAAETERRRLAARLELEMNETAAYRAHFRSANKDSLFRPVRTR